MPYWEVCKSLFNLSNNIIASSDGHFGKWTKWKYKRYFESLDLLTMLFSSKLRVGLKEMQVTMQFHNVQEYDGNFQDYLAVEEIDNMIQYNVNDVDSTEELLNRCKSDIDLRINIENEYKVNVLNKDGVNIGMEIIKQKYLEKTKQSWNQIKDLRSPCDTINIKDVILPFVKFETPSLQAFLEEFKQQTVSPGRKGYEKHILVGDLEHVIGVGGLHSVNKPEIIIPGIDEVLIDADVASLYPSMIIEHKFYPPHLGEAFLEVYTQIRTERLEAKHNGNKVKDATLKLALNGLSGNLQNENSFCYSPFTVMQIRINGQLLLLMLIEQVLKIGGKLVQSNTDGIFILLKKNKLDEFKKVCSEWEKLTKLTLEADYFEGMYQFAINDYIAVKKGYSETKNPNLIKTKGMFISEVKLGKGMAATIIPEAIIKCLVDKIPIEETIRNCKNIHKFITYQKVSRDYSVEYNGKLISRINRFYFSTDGPWLYKCKVDKDGVRNRYIKLNTKTGVTIMNKIEPNYEFPNNINYKYYIGEAQKIVSLLQQQQLSLF